MTVNYPLFLYAIVFWCVFKQSQAILAVSANLYGIAEKSRLGVSLSTDARYGHAKRVTLHQASNAVYTYLLRKNGALRFHKSYENTFPLPVPVPVTLGRIRH